MPKRPKLVLPSEETKHIAALLERELMQWPDVSVRPMFGMHAVYHGAAIFAALPDKRAMRSPRAIAYKLPPAARSKQDETWQVFEVESARDIGRVLELLDQAYRKAAAPRRPGQ
ncbi:MAG: hypothetical protein LAP39_25165 [Acidobacteriia bacterium]|nr:hypothetical protein [Terriglobia bacterium]